MQTRDLSQDLQQCVHQALATQTPLRIVGGNSKPFYGGHCSAFNTLELSDHCGILDYEPSELVIRIRSGTRLSSLHSLLAEHQQMLAFEPPAFGSHATIGGTLACGFAGPRRPYAGSARDFTLGCRILNGQGEILSFGGQVMKNVAGFDVSRLMIGALGTLGVLLDVALRVLPLPEMELTLVRHMTAQQALETMSRLAGQAWPLSAMAHDGEQLRLRLSGASAAIHSCVRQLEGDIDAEGERFWLALREQQLAFFNSDSALWRIHQAPASPLLPISGRWLIDWGGALRWLYSDEPAEAIHRIATEHQAQAVLFRSNQATIGPWVYFPSELAKLQQRIRTAFDPHQLLNPGRWPY